MSYKRVIEKKGKSYGPYVYESYRDKDGVVRKRYLGKVEDKSFPVKKLYPFFILVLVIVSFLLFASISYTTNLSYEKPFGNSVKSLTDFISKVTGFSVVEDEPESSSEETGEDTGEVVEDSGEEPEVTEEIVEESGVVEEVAEFFEENVEDSGEEPEVTEESSDEIIFEVNETEEIISETLDDGVDLNETLNETGEPLLNETISEELNEMSEGDSNETISEELNETEPFLDLNESVNETIPILNDTILNDTVSEVNESVFENETIEILSNETNQTLVNETIFEENLTSLNITTFGSQIVVNHPVRWIKKVTVNKTETENLSLEVPLSASNISVKTGEKAEESVEEFNEGEKETIITGEAVVKVSGKGIISRFIEWLKNLRLTGRAISEDELEDKIIEKEDKKEVNLTEFVQESVSESVDIALEYYTPAPLSMEMETPRGKRVVVYAYSELNYTDILAYSFLEGGMFPQDKKLKIYSYEKFPTDGVADLNESAREILEQNFTLGEEVEFSSYDINFDGYSDYVQWEVPSLSFQVYEIIYISTAEHLDENKSFVSDIYESVSQRDEVWSEVIPSGHFVRVVFEQRLEDYNDITIYARANGSSSIEVYAGGLNESIALFENITEEGWYRILLTNLTESEDTFYLRSNGSVEYDYIVDPSTCTGTATSCSSLGESDCGNQDGCSWLSSSCSGTATGCSTYETQSPCDSQAGCNWLSSSCSGTATGCSTYETQSPCDSQAGCNWLSSSCSGTPAACSTYENSNDCMDMPGCDWAYCIRAVICEGRDEWDCDSISSYQCDWNGSECVETVNCESQNYYACITYNGCMADMPYECHGTQTTSCSNLSQSSCDYYGCTWNPEECDGTATSCSTYNSDSNGCTSQDGCSFNPEECDGTATSCSTYNSDSNGCTSQDGCSFNPAECDGSATSCTSFYSEGECEAQLGCSWGDSNAPTYIWYEHNNTVKGQSTKFSLYVTDGTALNPGGYYIFSTNNTGVWANDSQVSFTATPSWANVTKTLNSTQDIVGYRWYLRDNAGNWRVTPVYLVPGYEISDCSSLQAVNNNLGGNYYLSGNIDCSATSGWNSGAGFLPIGNSTEGFTGYFDGNRYNITGLYIYRLYDDYTGLFGVISSAGVVKDVGLTMNVSGDDSVGGFVGLNSGVVLRSSSMGSVQGNDGDTIGGFVGRNEGNINDSYSQANVLGVNFAGGGFAGSTGLGTILNCYSTGTVSGTTYIGGFLGWLISGSVTNSFWDNQTSGLSSSAGGTGKTTAQMKDFDTFNDAGWDIAEVGSYDSEVWYINDGVDYPRLGEGSQEEQDTTAPTYSSAGHNSTLAGNSTLFSIDWNDETALNPSGQYIFSTNNTGSWVNDSAVNFTATPSSANVAKTLNSSVGISIGYRWYAKDDAGNWNATSIYSLTTTGGGAEDTTAPTYSSAGHNSTLAGNSTKFYALWNDDVALNSKGQYIFSTNNTGSWVNDSAVNFTSTPSWANVTKTLNSSVGISIGYRWYAKDDAGNWNATSIYSLITTEEGGSASSFLEFISPPTPEDDAVTSNTSIQVNVSISEGDLEEVKWNWNGTNYTIFNDSLVLFMNLDNRSSLGENNSFVRDLSNYGNNGSVSGATPVTGKYSGGYSFTRASSQYISMGSSTNNVDSNVYSISVWVKKDTAQTGDWQSIVARGQNGYLMTGRNTGSVTFGKQAASSSQLTSTGTPMANTNWHHLVGTYNGSRLRFYIDGVFDSYLDNTHTYDHTKDLRIGGDVTYGEYFGGTIDELMIFDRALSDSEVSQIYMSNLQKYNATQWYLYVNQSKNATSGLDEGIYTYYATAKDSSSNENKTETRSLTISSLSCGEVITESTTMTEDLFCTENNSVIIGSDNIVFDCAGHKINSTAYYAINSTGYDNVTIKNCNIFLEGGSDYGIYFSNTNESVIYNNTVTVHSSGSLGNRALWVVSSSDNNFSNNILASDYDTLYIGSLSDNNTFYYNNITSLNDYSVELYNSPNNTFYYNNITSLNDYALLLDSSSDSNLYYNNITSLNDYAIALTTSLRNEVNYNNFSAVDSTAVFFESSSNTLLGNGITASTNQSIVLSTSANNNITDTLFSSPAVDIYSYSSSQNNLLLNCTYDSELVAPGSSLVRKWYLDAVVNDSLGYLESANVTSYNSSGILEETSLTNSSGRALHELTEYINNGGT
ncbi:MAG: LamG-like jellyroll fold domain-containing protein, partial [Candidatus Pacearchaeota archaeon]